MTEIINNGKLFARIANVMAAVRSLQKDGNNKQSNYNYVSSANALENIGRAMAEQGLVIIPMVSGYKTETEGKCTRTTIEFNMHVCDADGNAFLAPWVGEGIDYGNPDKAANKAMTNATKYFLMKLFLVGAGDDDPDAETLNYETTAKKTPVTVNKPQQKPTEDKKAEKAQTQTTPQELPKVDKTQLARLHVFGTKIYGDDWTEKRHAMVTEITGGEATSSNDLTPGECNELILQILGQAAHGQKWPEKVDAACRQGKVKALRELPTDKVNSFIVALEKVINDKAAGVATGK